jgi:hypothetical protein
VTTTALVAAIVFSSGAAHADQSPPPTDKAASSVAAPAPETIRVTIDGQTQEVTANLPWRIVKERTGELTFSFGPGVVDDEFDGTVVAGWDGSPKLAQTLEAQALAANWACTYKQIDPRRSGVYLRGWVGLLCEGPTPSVRILWQFERNATSLLESITGWVKYAPSHYTSWVAGGTQGTDVYAYCNTSDGRMRTYTTYMRGEATSGYIAGWGRSDTSAAALPCGYSSPS